MAVILNSSNIGSLIVFLVQSCSTAFMIFKSYHTTGLLEPSRAMRPCQKPWTLASVWRCVGAF